MRRRSPLLSLACLLAAAALALASCGGGTNGVSGTGPALWRIADEDSEIWLFGSVHLLPPGLKWRTARIDAAFASAEELIVETDPSAEGGEALRAQAQALGMLPAGETLAQKVSPEASARLARAARRLGLPADHLARMRPWLAALTVSVAEAVRQGHSQDAGVETVLAAEARARGMRIGYFETPEQQIRILADLGAADEARFFEATLRQIEEEPDGAEALDAAWARGDVATLNAVAQQQIGEAGPAARAALLTKRNAHWAEEIAKRLEGEGRIFVAVGAAHMGGDDGLIALLRARGIEVEGP